MARESGRVRGRDLALQLGQLGLEKAQMGRSRLVLLRSGHLMLDILDLLDLQAVVAQRTTHENDADRMHFRPIKGLMYRQERRTVVIVADPRPLLGARDGSPGLTARARAGQCAGHTQDGDCPGAGLRCGSCVVIDHVSRWHERRWRQICGKTDARPARCSQTQAVDDMRAKDAKALADDIRSMAVEAKARAQLMRQQKNTVLKAAITRGRY